MGGVTCLRVFSENPHQPAAPRSSSERKACVRHLKALGATDGEVARAFAQSRRQVSSDRQGEPRTDRDYSIDPEIVVEGGLWYLSTYGRVATDLDLNPTKARATPGDRAYRSYLGWRSHKEPARTRALPRPQDIRKVFNDGDETGMPAFHTAVRKRMKSPYTPIDLPEEKRVARARTTLAGARDPLLYYPARALPAPCFGPPSDVIAVAGVRGHTAIIGDDPFDCLVTHDALVQSDALDQRVKVVIDERLDERLPRRPSSVRVQVRSSHNIKSMLKTHLKHGAAAQIALHVTGDDLDFELLHLFVSKRRTPVITASWPSEASTHEKAFFDVCATQYVYAGRRSGLTALDAIPMQWQWWWLFTRLGWQR